MPIVEAVTTPAGAPTLACFELSGRAFGVDVMQVREIVRGQPLTPLPQAPSLIEGVLELREQMVPVVDLGRALGTESTHSESAGRIVVVECAGLVLGLRVDVATEVLQVEPGHVEAVPDLGRREGNDPVRAVVRREGSKPVMVLCLEHLLKSVKSSGEGQPEAVRT